MKKGIVTIVLSLLCLGFVIQPKTALADSPLTSTNFAVVYNDIYRVKEAEETRVMNQDMAKYLADEQYPIDVKAAIINALSWEDPGRDNLGKYCEYGYGVSFEELAKENLSGHQLFCIGYLIAMDDYVNLSTSESLEYLKKAEEKMPESFTVAVIRSIVESMKDTTDAWDIYMVPLWDRLKNDHDMRLEAVNIIFDYMSLYHRTNSIIVLENQLSIDKEEIVEIRLFGTYMANYEVVKGSNLVTHELTQDIYGVNLLKLIGVKEGADSIRIVNNLDESVEITFAVNGEGTTYTPSIPKTGELILRYLWIVIMVVAAIGIVISIILSKNSKKKD